VQQYKNIDELINFIDRLNTEKQSTLLMPFIYQWQAIGLLKHA